jgi:hypothetical protein
MPDYTLSGGQLRLAHVALALAQVGLWGIDGDDYFTVAESLRMAADECTGLGEQCHEVTGRLGLVVD